MTVSILDNDHVLNLVAAILEGPATETESTLRAFFAPEQVEVDDLYRLGSGLGPARVIGPPSGYGSIGTGSEETTAIVMRRGRLSTADLAAMPHLKLIQRLGSGRDIVDLEAAAARGIEVVFVPRPSLDWTAEHAILLMLALRKNLILGDRIVRRGELGVRSTVPARRGDNIAAPTEAAYNWAGMAGLSGLSGQTLGIVGMGEVGRRVADRARAFGMTVIYTSRSPVTSATGGGDALQQVEMPELLARSDIVSLHVPGTAENRGLVDAAFLKSMRSNALLINTSRGSLIDEDALYSALRSGQIAGAGLDVHATEPRSQPDRFAKLESTVMTPHVAAGSRTTVVSEIAAIFDGLRRHGRALAAQTKTRRDDR